MSTAYSPLPTVNENAQETPKPTDEEALIIRRSSGVVFIIAFFQLAMTVLSFQPNTDDAWSIAVPTICGLFALFGIVGAIRKRTGLLIAHFIYSLACYIFTVVVFIYIVLNYYVDIWGYLIGFSAMMLQAFGLRHSRILIGLCRKYYPGCCRKWCRRQESSGCCKSSAPVASVGVNTAPADVTVSMTPMPPAEPAPMNPQMLAYQYQQPVMMIPVPAEYFQNGQLAQGVPLRYPMMYAPMQPNGEAPAAPQMYPAMYKQ